MGRALCIAQLYQQVSARQTGCTQDRHGLTIKIAYLALPLGNNDCTEIKQAMAANLSQTPIPTNNIRRPGYWCRKNFP
jgi:hypothetical protein